VERLAEIVRTAVPQSIAKRQEAHLKGENEKEKRVD
jgi:hypothetical protein